MKELVYGIRLKSIRILAYCMLTKQVTTGVKWEQKTSISLYYGEVEQCLHYDTQLYIYTYAFTLSLKGKNTLQHDGRLGITLYNYKDLCVDMKDLEFGTVVGRGSFATVHRGIWRGTAVALKQIRMLSGSSATITDLPKKISILRFL